MEPPLKRVRRDIHDNLMLNCSKSGSSLSLTSKIQRVVPTPNYLFSKSRLRVVSINGAGEAERKHVYCMPKVTILQDENM